MFRFAVTAVLVVLLVVPFGGCGGDDSGNGGSGQTSEEAAETIEVSLTDFAISPANPRVESAGQVEFRVRNDGETVHDLEVEGPGTETKLASELDPGQSGTSRWISLSRAATSGIAPWATTARTGWRARSPSPAKAEAPAPRPTRRRTQARRTSAYVRGGRFTTSRARSLRGRSRAR